jgi:hypothetical protein
VETPIALLVIGAALLAIGAIRRTRTARRRRAVVYSDPRYLH